MAPHIKDDVSDALGIYLICLSSQLQISTILTIFEVERERPQSKYQQILLHPLAQAALILCREAITGLCLYRIQVVQGADNKTKRSLDSISLEEVRYLA